jgi:hypothetical protein
MAKKTKKELKTDEDLLVRVRKRYKLMVDHDNENRRAAMEDMKFINVPGEQWEEHMKTERGDRPCYEFNKIRVTAKRVINDMRANRAQGKVRAVADDSESNQQGQQAPAGSNDKDNAEVFEGLIRNIWTVSDADTTMDHAAEYQVSAGMGSWRIATEFEDDSFDQSILIDDIPNPFCLFADPSAKDQLKRDAEDWVLTEKISKNAFESQYPKSEAVSFEDSEFDDDDDWQTEEEVRIAEYWWKEPVDKEIWQLIDGKVIDSESDEALIIAKDFPESIKRRRKVKSHDIMMAIVSGDAVLEEPTKWAGSMFPFVQVYGEYMIIDGKIYWNGIGRFAKDAQRSYNVSRTSITETIAMAPQAKYWTTPAMADGMTDSWAKAHKENFPFLMANVDPKMPGFPQKMGGADIPIALIQESQLASQEIDMVTGINPADKGEANSATSGRQEIARQQQGEIATFNYRDNQSKGILRTWELLIDLIPQVYDTEKVVRILGSDGSETYKKINTFVEGPGGEKIKVNDLKQGKYDATITTGPNFSTRRQEAAETYQTLLQGTPEIMQVAGDLIFKSMDLPYSEDIAERLKALLPPQVQAIINKDVETPPEVEQMFQQAEQAMQVVEKQSEIVKEAMQKADVDKAEVEKLIANLEADQANFEAKIAKETSNLVLKQANLVVKEAEVKRDQMLESGEEAIEVRREEVNEKLSGKMMEAIEVIQGMSAQFSEVALQTLKAIQDASEKRPVIDRIESKREKGKLIAVPIFKDDSD